VARVIKTLGRPVIATGFVGGRRGDQIQSDLNDDGILCDFVRIRGESRTSTAIVDPALNAITEINEQGPEIREDEIDLMCRKLGYLGKGADIAVVAGSLPRGIDPGCYGEIISQLKHLGVTVFFYADGEPFRLGVKSGPDFVFPRQEEAEQVIGYEFNGRKDLLQAAKRLREMGSKSAVITYRYGCVADLDTDDGPRRFVGDIPQPERAIVLGSGDALVAGYAVRLAEGGGPAECLRFGLGCAAANFARDGAGVLSVDDVTRMAEEVELKEVRSGA
jgi:1-phosphofructokinase family hexose kinase